MRNHEIHREVLNAMLETPGSRRQGQVKAKGAMDDMERGHLFPPSKMRKATRTRDGNGWQVIRWGLGSW